jgi:single-strand DNA-binding protein
MSNVNKAIVLGHLGRDPEVRYTQNGDPICNFSVATTERWKGKDGEKKEQTEWHRIVVWGAQAEAAGKYLEKGSMVYVEGKMTTRKWTDKDGVERYTTEIRAMEVKFLTPRSSGRGDEERDERSTSSRPRQEPKDKPAARAPATAGGGKTTFDDMPDDIPF